MRILVRRIGALGDVVLATPIVRRLRRENPDADLAVQTAYPDVFRGSPHRLAVFPPGPLPYPWTAEGGLDRTVELDLAYESWPTQHVVRAYMRKAFADPRDTGEYDAGELRQEMAFGSPAPFPRERRVVAVHAAQAGWRSRTLPEATWLAVVAGLRARGCFPLMVGTMRDALPGARAASFHSGDVLAQAAMIARCACFVGPDSGLLHVAGATDAPIVGVYTSVWAAYRMPLRSAGRLACVSPRGLSCLGCQARQPAPATTEHCERGDFACAAAVRAEDIVEAAMRLIEGTSRA
jgi:ADP-heptose:LPS heptosyltransferase